jgi:transcriptional regulator with XRE-family HTH domain
VYSASAFAEALQRYRRARGLTRAELAEKAHSRVRAVSNLERGLKRPQRTTVRLLTDALELQPDEARDFKTLAFGPGSVVLVEDKVGVGHQTRARRSNECLFVTVAF